MPGRSLNADESRYLFHGMHQDVEFFYNPLGIRVGKLVKPRQNGQLEAQENWTYYYYGYDANGQLMAVYDSKLYATNGETILEEQYIYGSDRIGVIKKRTDGI